VTEEPANESVFIPAIGIRRQLDCPGLDRRLRSCSLPVAERPKIFFISSFIFAPYASFKDPLRHPYSIAANEHTLHPFTTDQFGRQVPSLPRRPIYRSADYDHDRINMDILIGERLRLGGFPSEEVAGRVCQDPEGSGTRRASIPKDTQVVLIGNR
jgi:hypothetical protein